MKIILTRTGGFTGISLKKTIDTATLPEGEAQILEEFLSQPQERVEGSQRNIPDTFSYTLSALDSEKRMQVTVQESVLSDEQKSLLQDLVKS